MNVIVASLLPFVIVTLDLVQELGLSDDVGSHDDDLGSHIVDIRISPSCEILALANRRCKNGCCREKKRGEKRQEVHLLIRIVRLLRSEGCGRDVPPLFIARGAGIEA